MIPQPQTRPSFQTELARSREYEVAFSRWLEAERGYYTLPVFDCNQGGQRAPMLYRNKDSWATPDILASKDGVWAWFEIKLKDYAPLHRISGTYVTGLPLRNWQHYLHIREVTSTPIWMIFIHLKECMVVGGEIGSLNTHNIDHNATMNNGGAVFFAYQSLPRIMSLDKLQKFMGGR